MMDTLEALGITLPADGSHTAEGLSRETIEAAIRPSLERLTIDREQLSTNAKLQQRLIASTCKRLMAQKALEEALCVNEARTDTFERLELRVRLLTRIGDLKRLRPALDAYEKAAEKSVADQVRVLNLRLKTPQFLRPRDHRLFGTPMERIEDQLRAVPAEIGESEDLQTIANRLVALRGLEGAEAEQFLRQLYWSRAAMFYLKFLMRYKGTFSRSAPSFNDNAQELHARIMSLAEQAETHLPVFDAAGLEADRDAGRSVLFVQAHAGINNFWQEILKPLDMQTMLFASNARQTASESSRIQRIATAGGAQMAFMKAVKAAKKGQHLIRIFPDGHSGGDRVSGALLGYPATIGAGAATLGWYAKAATYFGRSRWREDGRLDMVAIPGPRAEEFSDKEAFETAFNSFYFAQLEDFASGPPEDMSCDGGLWTNFARE